MSREVEVEGQRLGGPEEIGDDPVVAEDDNEDDEEGSGSEQDEQDEQDEVESVGSEHDRWRA